MNLFRSMLLMCAGAAALASASPASAACSPVTIFFDWNSARVEDDSRAAIERLAVSLAWKGPDLDHILLTAHTDSSGSTAANRAMALRRAEAVRDLLLSFDVPARLIVIKPVGEDRLRVPTPDNVRERYNRRVELLMQSSAESQAERLAEGRPLC